MLSTQRLFTEVQRLPIEPFRLSFFSLPLGEVCQSTKRKNCMGVSWSLSPFLNTHRTPQQHFCLLVVSLLSRTGCQSIERESEGGMVWPKYLLLKVRAR